MSYNNSNLHQLSKDELIYLITTLEKMLTDPNIPLNAGECDFCSRCFMSTHNWHIYSDEQYCLCDDCYVKTIQQYGPDPWDK